MLSQPETLRHLIALTLNRGSELPSEVQDFENLLQFLAVYPCSEQTKWLCSQLWRQPEVYFERYQQLLALCTPVVQAHEAALQAEFDAAAAQTRAALAGEPTDFMQQFGMQHLALDQMLVCPSAAFFNGIGLSPVTISHHMSSLVSAGFIHVDKQNPRVSYSINKEFIRSFLENLSNTLLGPPSSTAPRSEKQPAEKE